MCEVVWEKDMIPEQLFENISQALLNAQDRDCLSGWGATVHVMWVPEQAGVTGYLNSYLKYVIMLWYQCFEVWLHFFNSWVIKIYATAWSMDSPIFRARVSWDCLFNSEIAFACALEKSFLKKFQEY